MIAILLLVIVVAGILYYQKTQNKNDTGSPIVEDQDYQDNKVVNVPLIGGILGLFAHSPQMALNRKLKEENANGWVVVEVIPANSGNLFFNLFRALLLLLSLFLFTIESGYYIIMERKKFTQD